MASVAVKIAGRSYSLSCGPGEEARVRDLAGLLDREASDIASKVGHVSESRLLLMAALSALDRQSEGETGAEKADDAVTEMAAMQSAAEREAMAVQSAQYINDLADRLESIAGTAVND